MSGTTCMPSKNSSLTARDIALILDACNKADVRVMKYAGLYLEFWPKRPQAPEPGVTQPELHLPELHTIPVTEITAIQKQQSKESLFQGEQALKEDQIAELWITDPYKAEQMLANGELDESIGRDDGDDEDS